MANYNLEKIVNEFNKADIEEKESAIQTLNDILAANYLDEEKKLKAQLEIVSAKLSKMHKPKS
jgi:uncharacterized coiled-coil protein SlyX